MFCQYCGAENPEGSKFCHTCGANIEEETSYPENATPVITADKLVERTGSAQSPIKRFLPFIAIGAACLAIAISLAVFFGSQNDKNADVVETSQPVAAEAATSNTDTSAAVATEANVASYYYLGTSDGKVAIFSNTESEPIQITKVKIDDLDSETIAELEENIPFDSIQDAKAQIKEYKAQIEKAAKKAEEADAKKAEEAAKKNGSVVTITIEGKDGSTRTAKIHRQGNSERVFPDSNTRYLTKDEVSALSDAERCIAWNEIIAASNGYTFMNSGLANYFAGCSWYHSTPGASGSGNLTDVGYANVSLLKSYTDGWWTSLATW